MKREGGRKREKWKGDSRRKGRGRGKDEKKAAGLSGRALWVPRRSSNRESSFK